MSRAVTSHFNSPKIRSQLFSFSKVSYGTYITPSSRIGVRTSCTFSVEPCEYPPI